MMISATQSTSIITALEQIGSPEHLCSIYDSQEEHFSVAIPFIRIGLARGEKCVYLTDDGKEDVVLEAAALAESTGRIAGAFRAAAKLGVPSSTLESKIKLFKINKNHFKADYQ